MTTDDRFAQDYRELRTAPELIQHTEVITGPVSDWATDFSHVEPEYAESAIEIWDDLRRAAPSRTRTGSAAPGCRPGTRTSPRSPTTRSGSHRGRSSWATTARLGR